MVQSNTYSYPNIFSIRDMNYWYCYFCYSSNVIDTPKGAIYQAKMLDGSRLFCTISRGNVRNVTFKSKKNGKYFIDHLDDNIKIHVEFRELLQRRIVKKYHKLYSKNKLIYTNQIIIK